jgi:hypothetical protein
MATATPFTQEQLKDYAQYEFVRSSSEYNMLDRRAQAAAGLSEERYMFVLKNYSAIRKQFEEDEDLMKLSEYFSGAD